MPGGGPGERIQRVRAYRRSGQAAYCASKFAVRGFTEAIRQDLRRSNVAVTLVFPGGVRTDIVKSSRSDTAVPPKLAAIARQIYEASLQTSPEDAALAIVDGGASIGQRTRLHIWRLRPNS